METVVKVEATNNELIIRQGQAIEQKPAERIRIDGNIKSISDFLSVRNTSGSGLQAIDKSKAVVIVDKKNTAIKLLLDPENFYGAEVSGKLEMSDELKLFFINQNKTFTREELVKLIKFNKLWFKDVDKHASLLVAYQSFAATTNTDTKNENDTRGNKTNNFSKKVDTNVPTEFILNIPVFKGYEKQTFRVEICLDVTDGGSRFWFESVELHELMQTQIDAIFEEELKAATGFVIINK